MNMCWDDEVITRLIAAVRMDRDYQELLEQCRSLEEGYCRIMNGLSDSDRTLLDKYIAVCEDMQYRMTQLAYRMGQLNNERNRTN